MTIRSRATQRVLKKMHNKIDKNISIACLQLILLLILLTLSLLLYKPLLYSYQYNPLNKIIVINDQNQWIKTRVLDSSSFLFGNIGLLMDKQHNNKMENGNNFTTGFAGSSNGNHATTTWKHDLFLLVEILFLTIVIQHITVLCGIILNFGAMSLRYIGKRIHSMKDSTVKKLSAWTETWTTQINAKTTNMDADTKVSMESISIESNWLMIRPKPLPKSFVPGPYNVICSNGQSVRDHRGNAWLCSIIERASYTQQHMHHVLQCRVCKWHVASNIMKQMEQEQRHQKYRHVQNEQQGSQEEIRNPLGCHPDCLLFVRQNEEDKRWYKLSDGQAREQIYQYLADYYMLLLDEEVDGWRCCPSRGVLLRRRNVNAANRDSINPSTTNSRSSCGESNITWGAANTKKESTQRNNKKRQRDVEGIDVDNGGNQDESNRRRLDQAFRNTISDRTRRINICTVQNKLKRIGCCVHESKRQMGSTSSLVELSCHSPKDIPTTTNERRFCLPSGGCECQDQRKGNSGGRKSH